MLRRLMFAAVALLVIAAGAWAFWPRPIIVDTGEVARRSFSVDVEEEGKARIREVFTLSAPVTGLIERIGVRAGDPVVVGETVLASIRPATAQLLDERARHAAEGNIETARAAVALAEAELSSQQAQRDFAETSLQRTRSLFDKGLTPAGEYDRAKLSLATLERAVAAADAQLTMRKAELQSALNVLDSADDDNAGGSCCLDLMAPASGVVLALHAESEAVVPAGTPLVDVGDPADLVIDVNVLSADATQIARGTVATIRDWGGAPLRAEVSRIAPVATTQVSALGISEQRVSVELTLLDPPEARRALAHGYRVVADIPLWSGADLASVPLAALFRAGEAWAVYRVEGGRAVLITVKVGHMNADWAELLMPLPEGTRVIIAPSDTITDGAAVEERRP